jgi:hypothetical protein
MTTTGARGVVGSPCGPSSATVFLTKLSLGTEPPHVSQSFALTTRMALGRRIRPSQICVALVLAASQFAEGGPYRCSPRT